MPQLYDHCTACGKEKTTYQQRMNAICAACSRRKQKENARKGHTACVDCGEPKTTYSQQLSERCNACAGKQKRVDKGEYYTHCIDCGEPKPLGTSRRHPRCLQCFYDAQRKNEYFDACQVCGSPKKRTKNKRCRSCANRQRWYEPRKIVKKKGRKRATRYPQCQDCGRDKAATTTPICKSCSMVKAWDKMGRKRVLYDTCQFCGKEKTKNDRELCLSCAGIKRMTEMYPDTDREYPYGWSDNYKESIRERDGRVCQLCGKTEAENGRKLDVHHTTYRKELLDPNFLVSLCMSCHPKTNWNRPYWIQVFTKYRGRELKQDWQRRVVVSAEKGGLSLAV